MLHGITRPHGKKYTISKMHDVIKNAHVTSLTSVHKSTVTYLLSTKDTVGKLK